MKYFKIFLVLFISFAYSSLFLRAQAFDQKEFMLGLYISWHIEKNNEVLTNHPDQKRLMKIASRIIEANDLDEHIFSFRIIRAPVANAFALPGGFVFVTDTLLKLKPNDEELAFLIGHEMSHVIDGHMEKLNSKKSKVSLLNTIAMLGAILLSKNSGQKDRQRLKKQGAWERRRDPGLAKSENANLPPVMATILAGNIFSTLYLLHSQRNLELDADLMGARLAIKAGYSQKKGIRMLDKLFFTNYRNSAHLKWQSHPLAKERIERLQVLLKEKKIVTPPDEAQLKLFRKKVALRFLKFYNELMGWKKSSFLPKDPEAVNQIRSILLPRALNYSKEKSVQKLALQYEVTNHLLKNIEDRSFLSGDYGLLYSKFLELKNLGASVDEKKFLKTQELSEKSLHSHLRQIKRSSPGYAYYQHMLKNFPKHEEVATWKLAAWRLNSDIDQKIEKATELIDDFPSIKKGLEKIALREENVLRYRKIMSLLEQKPLPEKMEKLISSCKKFEPLAMFQHTYPEDTWTDRIIQQRNHLAEKTYQLGRLASFSGEYGQAVQAFHKIILYCRDTDLAEDAQSQIIRLNTLDRP